MSGAAPPLSAVDVAAAELGKLRWRCRRGMKELDFLLVRYVEDHFFSASNLEREAFNLLLDTQDPVLYGYCLGSEPPPPQFRALIELITANSSGERYSGGT